MRYLKLPIYKFSELSKKAQQVALSALSDINIDFNWWDYIITEDAKPIGLDISEWDIEGRPWAKGEFNATAENCAKAIIETHGETCKTYQLAKEFMDNHKQISEMAWPEEKIEDEIDLLSETFKKELLHEYALMLESDREHLTSEAAIIETIEANEYDFTEDGKLLGITYHMKDNKLDYVSFGMNNTPVEIIEVN